MAGCGGRRPNMEEEADGRSVEMPPVPAAHQGPESSDHSFAHSKENPENSPKIQLRKKTVFTEAQLNTSEAIFKKKPYLSRREAKQLAKQLSLPLKSIQRWFKNRRKRNQKKLESQGPESSDDPSAAHNKENPEYLLKKIQEQKHKRFTEEQLDTLEAFFKKEPYPILEEREQLANQLSAPEKKIAKWFQHRRAKLKRQATSLKKTPILDYAGYSKPPTQAHQDLQHKQKMNATVKCVQAQKQSHLDSFPPLRPMNSSVLPLRSHSPVRVYCQNVGRPSGSSGTTYLTSYDGPSTSSAPSTSQMPITQDNLNMSRTSIWNPEPSITTDLSSYDGPSTSSAPCTSQIPISLDYFNLPGTSILTHVSSVTTDLTSYDGPGTSSAPRATQISISSDNFNLPGTSILTHLSSVTTDLTSYDGPSTSSAPSTFQMPISSNNFNLPGTSILTHVSSVTTDLTSYDGPSTSSAPSTSQIPISLDNFNLPGTSILTHVSSVTTDLISYGGPSNSSKSSAFQIPICPDNFNLPGTSICTTESSVTTYLISYDGPSISSAPSTSQMPIAQDNLNKSRTSIWNPEPSITSDLTSYDGPSTSSAPSTSQMPITQDNVDEDSSTDCSLVIDEVATYSD